MSCSFTIESLETRRLLAGNVNAAVDPNTGVFEIVGDNKANQIRLELIVKEVFLIGQNGTTINGSTASVKVPAAAIHVSLGNGNDAFEAGVANGGLFNTGSPLTVETGNGDDSVLFDNFASRATTVLTGNGNDRVRLIDLTSGGEASTVRIDAGNGDDSIGLESGAFQTGVKAASAIITGGKGLDTLTGIANLHVDAGGTQIIDDVEVIA